VISRARLICFAQFLIEKNSQPNSIKLNSANYIFWKTLMEDLLYTPKTCMILRNEGDSAKTEDMSNVDWKKMNRKAFTIIRQWLDLRVYPQVKVETNGMQCGIN
jgi:hypothetical protein